MSSRSPKVSQKSEVESPKSEEELKQPPAADRPAPTEPTELPTANSQLQTEQMEVHHHPEVEKKGFKEYILEGLMIFLAVTMGFFAESMRENITNGEHVKQLSAQLVQDLKSDTAALHEIDSAEYLILKKTDTLIQLLQQPITKADMKRIQLLTIECYSYWPFYPSTGGITAIKAELRLKQFSNSKTGSLITGYEGRTSILKKIEDMKSQFLTKYLEPFFRLHFTADNLKGAFRHRYNGINGHMRNLTQNDMTQLSVDLVLIRNVNAELILYNRKLKKQAVELMKYVTKQYHLENE
jgi:hypothetical protein